MHGPVVHLLLVVSTLAADPTTPHEHTGKLEPFVAGPPAPLSASELASVDSGRPLQKTVALPDGTGARATTVFKVAAPPSLVWECINDIEQYPRMVPGVAETKVGPQPDPTPTPFGPTPPQPNAKLTPS